MTAWIGLDDVTEASGCLWYVPGSHNWGLLPMTGLAGDMETVKDVLSVGQVSFFSLCLGWVWISFFSLFPLD